MSTTASALDSARTELASFDDRLIGPDDPRYDEARALFNAMIDKRPALIAKCATADDVAAVIRFARDQGLPLAIRGGGHNGGGLGSVDDGVVIDLSPMNSVSVDPARAHRARRRRSRLGRGRRRNRAAQPRSADRDHLDHGRRGPDARRRPRLPHAPARPDDRQPALGADGPRGRLAGHRQRGREPRPLLGDPRRRRQLRRRHRVHVPGASARDDRRRPDVLRARGRRRVARRVPRVAAVRSTQRVGLLPLPHRPAGGSRSRRRSTSGRCAASSGASTRPTRRPRPRWHRSCPLPSR